jgi:hypothetical protein
MELAVQRALSVEEVCLLSGLNDAGQEELVVAIQSDVRPPSSELEQIAREFPLFERVRFEVFKEFPRTATGTRKTQRSILKKASVPGTQGMRTGRYLWIFIAWHRVVWRQLHIG